MNPSISARPRTRALTSLAAALGLATLLAVGGALPAQAHDQLVSTDPKDGSTLDTPPGEITLTFSEAPLDVKPQIVVTDAAGDVVADGTPTIDGTSAVLTIDDGTLTGGEYSTAWRVVSDDGHPVEGTFTFTVAEQPAADDTATDDTATDDATEDPAETATDDSTDATSDTASEASPTTDATATAADSDASGGSNAATIALVTGGVVVVLVVVVVIVVLRRRGAGTPPGPDASA